MGLRIRDRLFVCNLGRALEAKYFLLDFLYLLICLMTHADFLSFAGKLSC